jgi:hypothetical protein
LGNGFSHCSPVVSRLGIELIYKVGIQKYRIGDSFNPVLLLKAGGRKDHNDYSQLRDKSQQLGKAFSR